MDGHPCDTCLRWPECNGIDQDTCQLARVRWYKPGPCPITPEQFEEIYNNDEED